MQIKSKYKIAKRLGVPIFEKTQTQKFALSQSRKKNSSQKRPRPLSDYGRQLLEKQKVRYTYLINERQLKRYISNVLLKRGVKQDEKLFEILETRLNSIAYRLGLGPTRLAVRQLVNHGHILLNGKRVNIPSCQVKTGDRVGIRPASLKKGAFLSLEERLKDWKTPNWLKFDDTKKEGIVVSMPKADRAEGPGDLTMVLEYYKR